MSRFDVDCFVKVPDNELICCICQCVLDQPVESPCRHVFCRICVTRWLDTKYSCPTCRHSPILEAHLKPALPLIQNMINKLEIRCKNFSNGCPLKFLVEFFNDTHQENCDYRFIKCKYEKCRREILAKHVAEHEMSCDWKEIQCDKQCGLIILVKDKNSHNCVQSLRNMVADLMKTVENLKTEVLDLRLQLSQVEERNNDNAADDDNDSIGDDEVYEDYYDLMSVGDGEEIDEGSIDEIANELDDFIREMREDDGDDDDDMWEIADNGGLESDDRNDDDLRSQNDDENSSDILAESDIDDRDHDDARSDSLAGFSDSPHPSVIQPSECGSDRDSVHNDTSDRDNVSEQEDISDHGSDVSENGSNQDNRPPDNDVMRDDSSQHGSIPNETSDHNSARDDISNNDNISDRGSIRDDTTDHGSDFEIDPIIDSQQNEVSETGSVSNHASPQRSEADVNELSSYRSINESSSTRSDHDALDSPCSPGESISSRTLTESDESESEKRDWRKLHHDESTQTQNKERSERVSRKRKRPSPPPSIPSTSGTNQHNSEKTSSSSSSDDSSNHVNRSRKRRKKNKKKYRKKDQPVNSQNYSPPGQDYLASWMLQLGNLDNDHSSTQHQTRSNCKKSSKSKKHHK